MPSSEPKRSPLSVGFAWASRVTTIGLEFTLPALAGWWLDGWLGTAPLGVILGAILGFAVGMVQVLHLGRSGTLREPPDP